MRKLLLVTVLALCGGVAKADNGIVYVGAGLTNDELKDIRCAGQLQPQPQQQQLEGVGRSASHQRIRS